VKINRLRGPATSTFYFSLVPANLLVALADAISGAYLALFAVERVHLDPLALGEVLTSGAVGGIVMNFVFGLWLDRAPSTLPLFLAIAAKTIAYGMLAYTKNLHTLLFIAFLPQGIGIAAFSQLLALAKRNLDLVNPAMASRGTAIVRASWSVAWAVGPAIGALAIGMFDYHGVFLLSAGFGLAAFLFLACAGHRQRPMRRTPHVPQRRDAGLGRTTTLAAGALILFHMALFLGSIPLPIVVTQTLGGTKGQVGLIYCTCAFLEILVMGRFVWRPVTSTGRRGIAWGLVAFVLYFLAITWAGSVSVFLLAQVLRAIGIGLVSFLGIHFLQSIMPDRVGFATALFSNTVQVGSVLAAIGAGGLAHLFGYPAIFPVCAGLSGVGLLLICLIRVGPSPRGPVRALAPPVPVRPAHGVGL
jgi:SET family sugar efflux transporter-like MFS transporter